MSNLAMMEQTLAIIKPDAVCAKSTGKIIEIIEQNGFSIDRMEKGIINREQAEAFYAVHKEKTFFGELVEFLTSGPIVVMAISKDNAINAWRELMGSTDSKKAAVGTIRNLFGTDIGKNAVHGSDSPDTAQQELAFFFGE